MAAPVAVADVEGGDWDWGDEETEDELSVRSVGQQARTAKVRR